MELPVADVDGQHACGARLKQAVREPPRRGAHVRTVPPLDPHPERVEGVSKLFSAPGDEPRRPLDTELGGLGDELPRLVVPGNESRQHQRLRLVPALRQASLDQENVEPLARGFQCDGGGNA